MTMEVDLSATRQFDVFQGLSDEDWQQIVPTLRSDDYERDTQIISVEQTSEHVYLVQSGTVKIYRETAYSPVIFNLLGAGELLGELAVIEKTGHPANVVTRERCRLLAMSAQDFDGFLHSMPIFTLNVARILARRLRFASQSLESVTSLDVSRRVAYRLLRLAEQWGVASEKNDVLIPLRLTQDDLAAMVGASRMSVNRAVNCFKERKWISSDRRLRVTIHDQAALRCQYC